MSEQTKDPAEATKSVGDAEPRVVLSGPEYREYVENKVAGKLFLRLLGTLGVTGAGSLIAAGYLAYNWLSVTLDKQKETLVDYAKEKIEITFNVEEPELRSNITDYISTEVIPGKVASALLDKAGIREDIRGIAEEVKDESLRGAAENLLKDPEHMKNITEAITELVTKEGDLLKTIVPALSDIVNSEKPAKHRAQALQLVVFFEDTQRLRLRLSEILKGNPKPEVLEVALDAYAPRSEDQAPESDERNKDEEVLIDVLTLLEQSNALSTTIEPAYKSFLSRLAGDHSDAIFEWLKIHAGDPDAELVVDAVLAAPGEEVVGGLVRLAKSRRPEEEEASELAWWALARLDPQQPMDDDARHEAFRGLWDEVRGKPVMLDMDQAKVDELRRYVAQLKDGATSRDSTKIEAVAPLEDPRIRARSERLRQTALDQPEEAASWKEEQFPRGVMLESRALANLLRLDGDWSEVILNELQSSEERSKVGLFEVWLLRIEMEPKQKDVGHIANAADSLIDDLVDLAGSLPHDQTNRMLATALRHASPDRVERFLEEYERYWNASGNHPENRTVAPDALVAALQRDKTQRGDDAEPYSGAVTLINAVTSSEPKYPALIKHVLNALLYASSGPEDAVEQSDEWRVCATIEELTRVVREEAGTSRAVRAKEYISALGHLMLDEHDLQRRQLFLTEIENRGLLPELENAQETKLATILRGELPHVGDPSEIHEMLSWHANAEAETFGIPIKSVGSVQWVDFKPFALHSYTIQVPWNAEITIFDRELKKVKERHLLTVGGESLAKLQLPTLSDGKHAYVRVRRGGEGEASEAMLLQRSDAVRLPNTTTRTNLFGIGLDVPYLTTGREHWITFETAKAQDVVISTWDLKNSDSRVVLFDGRGEFELGEDDDGGGGFASLLQSPSELDSRYIVRLQNKLEGAEAEGSFKVRVRTVDPSPNLAGNQKGEAPLDVGKLAVLESGVCRLSISGGKDDLLLVQANEPFSFPEKQDKRSFELEGGFLVRPSDPPPWIDRYAWTNNRKFLLLDAHEPSPTKLEFDRCGEKGRLPLVSATRISEKPEKSKESGVSPPTKRDDAPPFDLLPDGWVFDGPYAGFEKGMSVVLNKPPDEFEQAKELREYGCQAKISDIDKESEQSGTYLVQVLIGKEPSPWRVRDLMPAFAASAEAPGKCTAAGAD